LSRIPPSAPSPALIKASGTLSGLAEKGVGGLSTAIANARDYAAEVVEGIRSGEKGRAVA
jgi:hypothetical protein